MDGNESIPSSSSENRPRILFLFQVQAWVGAGQQPPWPAISTLDPETKALVHQWPFFTIQKGLLYRRCQSPESQHDILQLLVPRHLCCRVLQLVHDSVGSGHFETAKLLLRL